MRRDEAEDLVEDPHARPEPHRRAQGGDTVHHQDEHRQHARRGAAGEGEGLTLFAAYLFSNNVGVAIMAFALGFAFGIPTLLLLVYNLAVLGAMIFLGECLDLTDPAHTAELRDFYPSFAMQLQASDDPKLPHNSGGKDLLLRQLDCAMINSYMKFRDGNRIDKPYHYQTVRGIFVEGEPAYPGAAIYTKSHIQIAVRDPQCILGYFTPNLKDEV